MTTFHVEKRRASPEERTRALELADRLVAAVEDRRLGHGDDDSERARVLKDAIEHELARRALPFVVRVTFTEDEIELELLEDLDA